MSQTQSTSSEGTTVTTLAEGMRTDRETDKRGCPQTDCHGTLFLLDGQPCCHSCRCTPEGRYIPPEDHREDVPEKRSDEPSDWFAPHGREPVTDGPANWFTDRGTYANATVRLAGGYERVYDEDESNRPDDVDEEYTFDLSTL